MMARTARKKSNSGIYHIIIRGINRQTIFEDQEDCTYFLQILQRYKEISGYGIYAYCLMGNHVHLLIKIGIEPLEQVMRRLCGSYVYWYNLKYQRVGNLFQDRFKSEPVETDEYFQTVLRYIHQNPIKAGLVKRVEDYPWSSFHEYVTQAALVTTHLLLDMISDDNQPKRERFIEYIRENSDQECLDIDPEGKQRLTDEQAREIIKQACHLKNAIDLQQFDPHTRNTYIKILKERHHLSIRQIERLTGINRGIVLKA
ncbi:REP-associated tyrosine transposase [Acetonema longum]|uniref:Transposase n=1 Tax=Acetonema longum DSM 6540 TaxID=1009370 RepID=F7NLI2_9FIRM|nr:transposase [Acetonema longum]EGO63077.1 transposase [Acetonema longum DSM 6540]